MHQFSLKVISIVYFVFDKRIWSHKSNGTWAHTLNHQKKNSDNCKLPIPHLTIQGVFKNLILYFIWYRPVNNNSYQHTC